MLPKGFDLDELDDEIRNLVINLNRIPNVNKKTTHYGPTTCKGHVYEGMPAMPTKNGWIYFYKPTRKRKGLMKRINQFCIEYPFFGISSEKMREWHFLQVGLNPNQSERFRFYDLTACFEPDENKKGYYSEWSEDEQHAYMSRAHIREQDIIQGWAELDARIQDYIIASITQDIESLPYMEDKDGTEDIPSCPCNMY